MNRFAKFSCALQTILYETLRPIVLPFVYLFSTTWSICRHPIQFSPRIGDDLNSMRSALSFFSQAVLLEFVTLSLMLKGISVATPSWLNVPFVEEIAVFLFVAWFLVQTLFFMPIFWLITRTKLRIHCFVTASAYFNGAFLTILCTLPFVVVGSMISVLGLEQASLNPQYIRNCHIVVCLLFFVLSFVVLAGAIAALVGFINWLTRISHQGNTELKFQAPTESNSARTV